MLRRRRDGVAEAAAAAAPEEAAAPAADDAAVRLDQAPGHGQDEGQATRSENLELIGQEMVVASDALVPVEGQGAREAKTPKQDKKKSQKTPALEDKEYRTPPQTSGRKREQEPASGSASRTRLPAIEPGSQVAPSVPKGPPTVFGPDMLPLFTPDQITQMQDLQSKAPLLQPDRVPVPQSPLSPIPGVLARVPVGGYPQAGDGCGGIDPRVHGQFGGQHPGIDSGFHEGHQFMQRDMMWRAQMQSMMSEMSLQLRMANAENQKLRDELKEAYDKKDSSRFATPEEKIQPMADRSQEWNAENIDGEVQSEQSDSDDLAAAGGGPVPTLGVNAARGSNETGGGLDQAKTMDVILKILDGMQHLQKQVMKDSRNSPEGESETVRYSSELPKLCEWCPETSPIDLGDWLLCIHPHMSDLSATSMEWWELVVSHAKQWYDDHMSMTPIQRLTHLPQPSSKLVQKRWVRLERRAASLLMNALPESLREEVVSSKSVNALAIICKAMLQYQPGGLSERASILNALENPPEASSIGTAVTSLRKWIRWKRRAQELNIGIPDATILVRGLSRLIKKVSQMYPDLHFRLSLARNSLMIDTVPTQSSVAQYSEHILAELEQMGHHAKKKEPNPDAAARAKKFEGGDGAKGDGKGKYGSKPQDENEQKKAPCRYFLSDKGCKKGRDCTFGHVLDDERRCWNCGAKDHFANQCSRAKGDKKEAKVNKVKPADKHTEYRSSPSSEAPDSPVAASSGDGMKNLLDEAHKMLSSINREEAKEKGVSKDSHEERLQSLQKQLEELKKVTLKPFRISKLTRSSNQGLLDSGATHPLRAKKPGEKIHHLPRVRVTLAGDREVQMHLTPTGVIVGDHGTEPIVPMGMLTGVLQCTVTWDAEGLKVSHPTMGMLDVKVDNGCPMVTQSTALSLIEQIEKKVSMAVKSLKGSHTGEKDWIASVAHEHPVFQRLPERLKQCLIEDPADDILPLGNRRQRKFWRKNGVMIHAFSGKNEGYTLGRAYKEIGGDPRAIYEFDLLHGEPHKDLSLTGSAYPILLRLALSGDIKAWVGGPPCRTRSVLRHLEVEGESMPRPVRSWEGGEHGCQGLNLHEQQQVFEDDVVMYRYMMLYVISEEVRKSKGSDKPVGMMMEQPAAPKSHPEVVSIWRTMEWRLLAEIYKLKEQTFNQSEFGAVATKPTTVGGTLLLDIPLRGRKGQARDVTGLTPQQICAGSRSLARWPPLMMRSIATALHEQVMGRCIKMRLMSWQEHVAAGHVPFRKDCKVCQESAARDFYHKRSKLPPRAGVLSMDMAGPFHESPDLHSRKAKYLLVATFTWPKGMKTNEQEEDDSVEVPEDAPQIEDESPEAQEEKKKREEEVSERIFPGSDEEKVEEEVKEGRGELHEAATPPTGDQVEEEPQEEVEIEVHKLVTPLPSRQQKDVMKAVVDMYMALRADGFIVTQLHTDCAGEFVSQALADWCSSRTILHSYTPGDQPQTNGRCEAAVQATKAQIRRMLHGAKADFSRWPLAARCANELWRLKRIGQKPKLPPFLTEVLIRKRFWRTKELEPTQEKALYIMPSFVHHGHWVERSDGSQVVSRMVMHGLNEPPNLQTWIALEDELNPIQLRRRLRGKTAVQSFLVEGESTPEERQVIPEDMYVGDEEEDKRMERDVQLRRLIEEEMSHAIYDDPMVANLVVDTMASLKEATIPHQQNEVLQTRVVSQAEVRRNVEAWIPSIKAELESLFTTKEALVTIQESEVKALIDQELAEIIPSKLVFTLKPDQNDPMGRKKARLVACGNFVEATESASELFAGGATAVALRAALSVSSQFGWFGLVLDIKTAFLNAPMQGVAMIEASDERKPQKRTILKPPPLLIAAGLARPTDFYEALKAVYGYRQSPRLWSDFRDLELSRIRIPYRGTWLRLNQLVSEPSMWRITPEESEDQLVGMLLTYVDDFLLTGEMEVIDLVARELRNKWETSKPELVDHQAGVRFLGTELWRSPEGLWFSTQINYTTDLLRRNLGEEQSEWTIKKLPMAKEVSPPNVPGDVDIAKVRQAQRVVGELVWLSTRTRPDIGYAVSRMASLITKDPGLVVELARQVWNFLAGTIHHGLVFRNQPDEKELRVYTDASFNETCQGCVLVFWGESLLLWKSSRQPVVTVSTAECELVEIMEGVCSGEAIRVVMEEMLYMKVRSITFTDSSSAMAIISGDSGSWRTRHLRKRAQALRSRVLQADWLIRHIPGREMPADVGTKVLSTEKFEMLKKLLGMVAYPFGLVDGPTTSSNTSPKHVELEKALKLLIVVAQIGMAQGRSARITEENYSDESLVGDAERAPWSWSFVVMVWATLFLMIVLVMIGAMVGMRFMWQKVSAWFRDEPHDPLPQHPQREHEQNGGEDTTIPSTKVEVAVNVSLPRKRRVARATASTSPSSSSEGDAAARTAAAASSAVRGPATRAAAASSGAARDAVGRRAAASETWTEAAAEGRPGVGQGTNRRVMRVFVTQTGSKYHLDSRCRGLRKVKGVIPAQVCAVCGFLFEAVGELWTKSPGDLMHPNRIHANQTRDQDPLKKYQPCKICAL